jgi:hypothetical protein
LRKAEYQISDPSVEQVLFRVSILVGRSSIGMDILTIKKTKISLAIVTRKYQLRCVITVPFKSGDIK